MNDYTPDPPPRGQILSPWLRPPRRKPVRSCVGLGMMIFAVSMMLTTCSGVHAQGIGTPGNLAGLMAATPSGDWSMKLWQYVFGDFATSPFTPGSPDTLLGKLFVIFNAAVFTVGFSWAMYGVVTGVVQTAHEGEVLGKRLSTVWFPIRMIVGISGLMPVFKGFTLFQSLMMLLTAVGIGIGNSLWSAGVNATSDMQALVNQNGFQPTAAAAARKAVQSIFISGVCIAGEQDAAAQANPPLAPSQGVGAVAFGNATSGGYNFGSPDDPTKCGSLMLTAQPRSGSSVTSYRAGAVDYSAIATTAQQSYIAGIGQMVPQVLALSQSWYQQRQAANIGDTPMPAIPKARLDALADQFNSGAATAIAQAQQQTGANGLRAGAKQNMLALGWFGAGAWFSTMAEANAALADAARGPDITTTPAASGSTNLQSSTASAVIAAGSALDAAYSHKDSSGDTMRPILDSAIQDTCAAAPALSGALGTATGNCSLGQSIVSAAMKGLAIGSGGGGSGATPENAGLVNPVIMMKNIGDYVMGFASTVLTVVAAGHIPLIGPMISKGLTVAGSVVGGPVAGLVSGVWEQLKGAAWALLAIGALLSTYIPMIPFITWMGAILAYAASVIEGIAGASLHAMAHLEGEGEGLGGRTSHGYMFMINVLARPALMVIGFFVATALMIIVGTLQAQLFLPAMADVQGNSITGLASIFAFLLIFGIMNITLISASFNMIYVITDQVIGLVGGNVQSHLGRETESKVHAAFVSIKNPVEKLTQQAGKGKAGAGGGER